jgi:HAD superfamily hydrolase (TIGR01509 family)
MTRLLVLDFHGVCTLSPAELIAASVDPGDLAASARPEAREVVAAAKGAGISVMVLSNELDPEWADRIPMLTEVDKIVACSDNGIFKPDRRAFQRCMLLAGADPGQTCVVDDGADNVAVARSLGATAVHFEASEPNPWGPVYEWLEA